MCRASDRVRKKKTFCGILEANCAGNNMNIVQELCEIVKCFSKIK